MGHNFGLWHSHSLDCGATTLGSSCNRSEYGDVFDTMGSSSVHYNAFQKERLGWLNYNQSSAIATVESGSTTVTLTPYSAADSGIKALKVLKGMDAATGEKNWYYVEFRQPLVDFQFGFDAVEHFQRRRFRCADQRDEFTMSVKHRPNCGCFC